MDRNRLISLLLIPLFVMLLAACDSGNAAVSSANTSPATTSSAASNNKATFHSSTGNTAAPPIASVVKPEWIMFSTTWCPICKAMRPTVYDLKTAYQAKVNFAEIDREDPANAAMVKKYGINAQPIFVFLDKNGNMTQEIIGGTDRHTLEEALDKLSE